MEFSEILEKERKILRESSWGDLLRSYIYSSNFTTLIGEIVSLINEGKRFSPTMSNLFKPFVVTDYKNCNVIILNGGYDDIFYIYHEGLALDTGKDKQLLSNALYETLKIKRNNITEYLSSQGVLCLNDILAITKEEGREKKKYENFLYFFFELLYQERPDIIVVEIDSNSNWKGEKIHLSKVTEKWKDKHPFFVGINEKLKELNKEEIKW